MKQLFGLLLFLVFLSGCGRKGPLVRPEALVPEPVRDFTIVQKGDRLQLSWSQPGRLVSGGKLTDLAGFKLFVRSGTVERGACAACPDEWKLDSRFDLDYLQGAVRSGPLLISSYPYPGRGVTRSFRIVAYTKDSAESPPSDRQVTGHPVLLAPTVTSSSSHASLAMSFTPPPLPDGFTLTGYAVYRYRPGEPVPALPHARITDGSTFEDHQLELGVTYSWLVTATATVGPDRVESLPASLSAGLKVPD